MYPSWKTNVESAKNHVINIIIWMHVLSSVGTVAHVRLNPQNVLTKN